jgi:hypothetical protein
MEAISWSDRVKNKEVLQRDKEDKYILPTIRRRKANLISHIMRRNCCLKHVTGGKIEGRKEVKRRRDRTRKQLLDDFKKTTGYLE